MRFTDRALDDLRAAYRRHFGDDITRDEAAEIGNRLVGLIEILLRLPSFASRDNPDVDA